MRSIVRRSGAAALVIASLLYLNSAAFSLWASGGPPSPDPLAWLMRGYRDFAISLILLAGAYVLFRGFDGFGQHRSAESNGRMLAATTSLVLALVPAVSIYHAFAHCYPYKMTAGCAAYALVGRLMPAIAVLAAASCFFVRRVPTALLPVTAPVLVNIAGVSAGFFIVGSDAASNIVDFAPPAVRRDLLLLATGQLLFSIICGGIGSLVVWRVHRRARVGRRVTQ